MKPALAGCLACAAMLFAGAGSAPGQQPSPYAGEEQRVVKALSDEERQGLLEGAGLGYAKAAELNGWPGPLHVIELQETLALTPNQLQAMESLWQEMKSEAIPLGRQLVEAERALDLLFAAGRPSAAEVEAATANIAALEGRLRAVHLVAHLRAAPILTRHQTMLYRRTRGYGATHDHGGHTPGD
ncbi:MAG: hypothetical protein JSU82_00320 [Rhodospirillales bacterium]|nr:MAG: hypothetical protein JSU82_00320 [Rhodospirillales bacterium]